MRFSTVAFLYLTACADGSATETGLEISGELRTDLESFQNKNWEPDDDDGYYLHRLWLKTEWKLTERLSLHVDPIHSLSWGKNDVSPVDEDRFALQGLYFNFDTAQHNLSFGRQEVDFGSGRLVSARKGPNVPRAFDGIRHTFKRDGFSVDSFYLREVRARRYEFDNPVFSDEAQLWGAYGSVRLKTGTLELYYLRTEQRDNRHTFGLRWAGESLGFDWDLEAIGQLGDPIRAWSVASALGYSFEDMPMAPRIGLKMSVSSGDRSGTNRKETFSPLFPRGDYFSESATVGPRNHIEIHPTLSLRLSERTTVFAQYAALWRQSSSDAVYDVPGFVIRAADPNSSRFIGQEISLNLANQLGETIGLEISASYFHPGGTVKASGSSDPVVFGKLSMTWSF